MARLQRPACDQSTSGVLGRTATRRRKVLHLLDSSIRPVVFFSAVVHPILRETLETYCRGLFHALDRYFVADERPNVVDSVSA